MFKQPEMNTGGISGAVDFRTPAIPTDINTNLPDEKFTSKVDLDIPYANQSQKQKLDVYIPSQGSSPFPVIVLIHGGGWLVGDKRWNIEDFGNVMMPRGFAVVSVNHRGTDEAIFPAQVFDIKAAVRWIRGNAGKYQFDPGKIIAWGGSSGGHLASFAGTSGHVKEMEDLSMGYPGQSSRVNMVVNMSGPIDFLQLDAQKEQLGLSTATNKHDVDYGPESRFVGGKISTRQEVCKAANPMTYINDDNPPFYIQHGKNDEAVPYLQSLNLANALKEKIGEDNVILDLDDIRGHGNPSGLPVKMDKLIEFINKKLK